MILVDTSVLIGFLKGQSDKKVMLFESVLERDIPFGISPYTYQEVLQGARDDAEFTRLRDYLSTQTIYYLPNELASYELAAKIFFDLRRKGTTVRGTLDVLIALTAIEHNLILLHNDRDFDAVAKLTPELKILESI
ncbi:MAG: PIN domain nuclease [Oscillospiraceae bacterium]|jgi:predicted nucleic acid-binding protein|nr:PIN domain nuclease [Oscillospiraceae bacterium]